MTTEEDIRKAEQAVIEAARLMENTGPNGGTLVLALTALDALKSPLPSGKQMYDFHMRAFDRGKTDEGIEACSWANCLRWVAGEMRVSHAPGAIYNMMPGSPTYQDAFEGAQKQLRAWADELENRK